MTDTLVQLGDFVFAGLEVPEVMPLGGAQRLAVHDFPGGARTVQALGFNHAPISWSGLMLGGNALDRAKYLDFLRVQGQSLPLTLFDSNYTVVIDKFEFRVERFYKVQYSISVIVVSDNTQPVQTIAPSGFDAAIGADCGLMAQLSAGIGNVSLTASISTLQTAVGAVSSFASASTSVINSTIGLAANVLSQVTSLKAIAQSTIGSVSTLGGVIPGGVLGVSVGNFAAQLTAGTQYPILQNIGSLATRVTRNLGMANLQSSTKTIQVGGGTLFDVAASQYGDPTQWVAIAKASGIFDPTLTGIQTLTVPASPAASGGVLSQ
jgi:hypothetical protein